MATEQIILDIRAQVDKAAKDIKELKTQVSGVNKEVAKTEKMFDKAAAAIGTFFAAQKIIQWGKEVGQTIMDFQEQVSGLSAITGAVGKDLDFMRQKAIDLSVQLKKSAKDIVEAFQLVGSAKPDLLKNAEALAEVTKQAIILSKAAKIDVAEAANIVTKALNMWGKGAESAAKFTDILADSQKKGTALVRQLGESLQNAGSIAAAVGMSFESTNATLQAFAKGGIDGLKAGMAFNIVVRKLATSANQDFNPSYRTMTEVLDNLAEKGYDKLANATKLVGEEGARHLLTLVQQRDVVRQLEGNLGEAGIAMSQMETNTDNLRGAIDELKASWDQLVLSIESGEGAIGWAVKTAIEAVSNITQMQTTKVKVGRETRKTLGPLWRYLFAGDKEEKADALEDARMGGMRIGLAVAESVKKVSDFFGFKDGLFGITEESLKELRSNIEIAQAAQDTGEDVGKEIVKGIKTGLESLSEEDFKALLNAVRMIGATEEEGVDMGIIEAALTMGKGYTGERTEAEIEMDKRIAAFDEAIRLETKKLENDQTYKLEKEKAYADAAIKIEQYKQEGKFIIAQSFTNAAGELLYDSAVGQLLISIAESIISTYMTAQFAKQGMISSIPGPAGIIAGEAAYAQAVIEGWINTALIAAVSIPKFFGKGGYTGDDSIPLRDPQGKPLAGFVHKNEFVFDEEKTKELRPFFEDIHTGRIDARALAALTQRGIIVPIIKNDFNSKILENEVGKIYRKMQEKDPQRYTIETSGGIKKVIGNTTININ